MTAAPPRNLLRPPVADPSRRRGPRWLPRSGPALIWLLVIALGCISIYPIVRLFLLAFRPGGHFALSNVTGTLEASYFGRDLLTTVIAVGCSVVLAVLAGAFLAWANMRTDATLGWFGQMFPFIPIVIPHMALAAGWVLLCAPRVGFLRHPIESVGWLNQLIPSIYSMWGLVFVMTLILIPYVYLILQTAFRNLDPALEEASLVSGAGVLRTLFRVSIPALRNAIFGAALLAVIVGSAEYAVPLFIGTPANLYTLSVDALQAVTAQYPPALGEASVIGMVMMLTTGLVWLIYFRVARAGRFAQITGRASQSAVMHLGRWRWVARLVTLLLLLCTSVLPLGALIVVSFQPYWNSSLNPRQFTLSNIELVFSNAELSPAIANSARFAAVGAAIAVGIVIALTSAAKIGRQRSASVGLAVIKLPAAVASLVLGIGFLIAYYGRPFDLGNTAILLVGAYIIIFLPHASILGEAATNQVGQSLVEASEVSGARWWRTQLSVLTPLTAQGFLVAYALIFALMSGEASVSRMLAGPGTAVAGFSILELYDSGTLGQVAVLAAAVTCLNFVVVGGLVGLSRLLRRNW
jgi:iron(III) transport system permease protein